MFPSDERWFKSNSKLYTSDSLLKVTYDYKKFILNNAKKEDIVVISRIVVVYTEPVNKLQGKLYSEALFYDKDGKSISRAKSLDLWFKDLELFVNEAKKKIFQLYMFHQYLNLNYLLKHVYSQLIGKIVVK